MLKLYFVGLLFLSLTCGNCHANSQCSQDSNGFYRFGHNCGFLCHCLNSTEQCDETSGLCVSGCDWEWGGPGCQYKNIALNQSSRHLDNIPSEQYSHLANDYMLSTCSETNFADAGSSRIVEPWWKIWFPQNNTFRELSFLTRNESLEYFRSFKVTVEYVPSSQSTIKEYYPSNSQTCYIHPDHAPRSTSISVICDRPLVGNQVRIQLASKYSQLVICDVRVFAGRNLAFDRPVVLSSSEPLASSSPGNAEDGVNSTQSWDNCSTTAVEAKPWLEIDLGFISDIRLFKLGKNNDDSLRNYQILASNVSGAVWKVIYENSDFNPETTIRIAATAQYIRIQRMAESRLSLCEVQIFGDCPDGVCGLRCAVTCNCKHLTLEEKVSGFCSSGCLGRWTGKDSKCDNECSVNEWGQNCSNECGHCYKTEPCDVNTGRCSNGCFPGYLAENCSIECDDGSYGQNCLYSCSDNCRADDQSCNKTDGHCPDGFCKPGYTGDRCEQHCPQGWFGNFCSNECSENCLHGRLQCNHVDGQCTDGCKDGWTGAQCDRKCEIGKWGPSCSQTCGHCRNGTTCRYTDGVCERGCFAGYQTSDLCITECGDGAFGLECSYSCSPYCLDTCNKEVGTCVDCIPGWQGETCTLECSDGRYGKNCTSTCSENCWQFCNKTTGFCLRGCKPGYKGDICDFECDHGTYGRGCVNKCSPNCFSICAKTDGLCSCKPGWKGIQCNTECEFGEWGIDCSRQCGKCVNGSSCNRFDGVCDRGCMPDYSQTIMCDLAAQTHENNKQSSIDAVPAIVGGLVAFIVAVAVSVTAMMFVLKRLSKRVKANEEVFSMYDRPSSNIYEEKDVGQPFLNDDDPTCFLTA